MPTCCTRKCWYKTASRTGVGKPHPQNKSSSKPASLVNVTTSYEQLRTVQLRQQNKLFHVSSRWLSQVPGVHITTRGKVMAQLALFKTSTYWRNGLRKISAFGKNPKLKKFVTQVAEKRLKTGPKGVLRPQKPDGTTHQLHKLSLGIWKANSTFFFFYFFLFSLAVLKENRYW